MAKTSEPSLTRTEFDLLSLSLQGKPSLMRDFFSSYRNSKEHKIPLPCTCTVYFLFTAFFLMLCNVFDLFPLKNHQATDNKKIEAVRCTASSRRDKDHEITIIKEDFYLPTTWKEL